MKRIMYIENKAEGIEGPGRIGWVEFSKSGRSFYYDGRRFEKTKSGFKHNCFEAETGDPYWISGPTKNGQNLDASVIASEALRATRSSQGLMRCGIAST